MKSLIAIVALAASTLPAIAQEATIFDTHIANPRPRAEVRAETDAAMQRGARLSQGNYAHATAQNTGVQRTRAEVRAEVIAAMADGERLSYGEARRDPLPSRSQAATRLAAQH